MAEGYIPWSSIDRYAQRHGIAGWDFERFKILIRNMDLEYINYLEEQRKKKTNTGKIGHG